jgi:hypothetical protein
MGSLDEHKIKKGNYDLGKETIGNPHAKLFYKQTRLEIFNPIMLNIKEFL